MNYYIKRPNNKRKTFSIYRQIVNSNGTTENKTVKSPDITAANLQFLNKTLDFESTLKVFTDIKNKLSNNKPVIFNTENQEILSAFLKTYFKKKRFLIDKDSAQYKFQRAINCLGYLSIQTGSEDELTDKVLSNEFTGNKNREIFNKLNSVLRWLGRDNIKLSLPPKEFKEVQYLDDIELNLILNYFKNKNDMITLNLIKLSFYSGLRIGELLAAIEKNLLRTNGTLNVGFQIDKAGNKRTPKNNKIRSAYLLDEGIYSYKWLLNQRNELEKYNRNLLNKRFKKACLSCLNKNLKWHDLRHSYAVYLIGKGVPIQLVAQSLGDSVAVCEEYYSGFVLTDYGINTIKTILDKS